MDISEGNDTWHSMKTLLYKFIRLSVIKMGEVPREGLLEEMEGLQVPREGRGGEDQGWNVTLSPIWHPWHTELISKCNHSSHIAALSERVGQFPNGETFFNMVTLAFDLWPWPMNLTLISFQFTSMSFFRYIYLSVCPVRQTERHRPLSWDKKWCRNKRLTSN